MKKEKEREARSKCKNGRDGQREGEEEQAREGKKGRKRERWMRG